MIYFFILITYEIPQVIHTYIHPSYSLILAASSHQVKLVFVPKRHAQVNISESTPSKPTSQHSAAVERLRKINRRPLPTPIPPFQPPPPPPIRRRGIRQRPTRERRMTSPRTQ